MCHDFLLLEHQLSRVVSLLLLLNNVKQGNAIGNKVEIRRIATIKFATKRRQGYNGVQSNRLKENILIFSIIKIESP